MVGERVASVLSRRQGTCPGVEPLPDILAGPDRPSGASGRHDSRSWSWRRPATTTLDESTSARMAMMTCSGREAQASQRRASLERNRSAVGKTANSLVYPRRQHLTPLPAGARPGSTPRLNQRGPPCSSRLGHRAPGRGGRRALIPSSGLQSVDTFPKTRPLPSHSISTRQTPCPSRLRSRGLYPAGRYRLERGRCTPSPPDTTFFLTLVRAVVS